MRNLKGLLGRYASYLKAREISTYRDYLATVKEYVEYSCLKEPGEATVKHAYDYKLHLLSPVCRQQPGTVNNKLARLRSFYRFLMRRGLAVCNPFREVDKLRQGHTLPRKILGVEDMGRLLDNFGMMTLNDVMLRVVVELLYGSAMRVGEVAVLKLQDVEFTGGIIIVTDLKNAGVKKKRPATEVSLRLLKHYLAGAWLDLVSPAQRQAGFLFPQEYSARLRTLVNRKLKKECRRLDLLPLTSHSLRHSAATHMLRAGAGIRDVQEMLGHEKINSTERYTHVVKEDLKKVVCRFHPRERMR